MLLPFIDTFLKNKFGSSTVPLVLVAGSSDNKEVEYYLRNNPTWEIIAVEWMPVVIGESWTGNRRLFAFMGQDILEPQFMINLFPGKIIHLAQFFICCNDLFTLDFFEMCSARRIKDVLTFKDIIDSLSNSIKLVTGDPIGTSMCEPLMFPDPFQLKGHKTKKQAGIYNVESILGSFTAKDKFNYRYAQCFRQIGIAAQHMNGNTLANETTLKYKVLTDLRSMEKMIPGSTRFWCDDDSRQKKNPGFNKEGIHKVLLDEIKRCKINVECLKDFLSCTANFDVIAVDQQVTILRLRQFLIEVEKEEPRNMIDTKSRISCATSSSSILSPHELAGALNLEGFWNGGSKNLCNPFETTIHPELLDVLNYLAAGNASDVDDEENLVNSKKRKFEAFRKSYESKKDCANLFEKLLKNSDANFPRITNILGKPKEWHNSLLHRVDHECKDTREHIVNWFKMPGNFSGTNAAQKHAKKQMLLGANRFHIRMIRSWVSNPLIILRDDNELAYSNIKLPDLKMLVWRVKFADSSDDYAVLPLSVTNSYSTCPIVPQVTDEQWKMHVEEVRALRDRVVEHHSSPAKKPAVAKKSRKSKKGGAVNEDEKDHAGAGATVLLPPPPVPLHMTKDTLNFILSEANDARKQGLGEHALASQVKLALRGLLYSTILEDD